VFGEVDVALELQRWMLAGRVMRGEERSETQTRHAAMVRTREIVALTGPATWHDLAMEHIELEAPHDGDVEAMSAVVDAQDIAWWGEPDGDIDDLRHELERVEQAMGSLDAGARVAWVDGALVGVAMVVGHGHTTVAVDPSHAAASAARVALFGWLAGFEDVQIESPAQDAERLSELASLGFAPNRSSFELERPGDASDATDAMDLGEPVWPDGFVPVPFRLGIDDQELHDMIYAFWTDVAGHTHRPIDEWRTSILAGPWFDADLVVIVRDGNGDGPIVGCALGRTFTGDVGWVSQLGVAPSARGIGLGRATLIEACRRLSKKQPKLIGLGVEAENANALGLYRSVGFEVVREWMHCVRDPASATGQPEMM
jgi:mycothiol synthase